MISTEIAESSRDAMPGSPDGGRAYSGWKPQPPSAVAAAIAQPAPPRLNSDRRRIMRSVCHHEVDDAIGDVDALDDPLAGERARHVRLGLRGGERGVGPCARRKDDRAPQLAEHLDGHGDRRSEEHT